MRFFLFLFFLKIISIPGYCIPPETEERKFFSSCRDHPDDGRQPQHPPAALRGGPGARLHVVEGRGGRADSREDGAGRHGQAELHERVHGPGQFSQQDSYLFFEKL